jgi:hypothetical protein
MRSSRRSKLDRAQLTAALTIIDDGVGRIVAEIARERPQPPAPKRRPHKKAA